MRFAPHPVRYALGLAALSLPALAGCQQASPVVRDSTPSAGTVQADWSTSAEDHRGRVGERFTYVCPPNGSAGSAWGTGTYSDDSSVCTAAVHAGALTTARGGRVVIEMRPGQSRYEPSTRNGVTTSAWDAWDGSFVVVQ